MSWKAVEMQIALPRTQDAGRIQEQIQQRGQFMQDLITREQLQSEETKRRTVNDLEQKANIANQNDPKGLFANEQTDGKHTKASAKMNRAIHPYLGKRIDFNG